MTADGDGVRLVDSPVPVESSTDQLRSYPVDLLASPLDVRSFSVATEPGTNTGGAASVSTASGDPFSNAVAALDRRLEDLIGDRELTPLVGTLAVLLAVLLGCGHALLPGHGKTVMAAYLAGRDGRPRDAVTVGATVTATHTAGVLALGLAISASSSLAGDQVIRWLGVVSGLLVAGIGVAMLRGAVPRWLAGHGSAASPPAVQEPALAAATAHPAVVHGSAGGGVATAPVVDHPHERPFPRKGPRDHDHDHDHDHPHERPLSRKGPWDHDHPHPHPHPHPHDHDHDHDHPHGDRGHDHGDHEHHSHDHGHHDHAHHDHAHHDHGHGHGGWWSGGHSHGPGGHTHGPGTATLGRGGLVGMGIAGGLVPSPSALIVLLGSIGLGRTVFGVLLVLAYGLGMAGTLTAVGLLLVRLRGRLQQRAEAWGRRGLLPRLARALPVLTASLVLLVGLTLAVRGVLLG
ncbi:nickel transporter [Modestobacter sp. I12A-02628]|uniref:Nickel transporter n=2 Tax=Goekera deserti TaxID=2497753 RepID=A0A7K3WI21_9ACTN|nr:nickel transporter [Goekera deserti]NDI48415.1 nickel transporter [Goekera deserti]NEL56016.1 nickel transporter [Goekera deserti]